jgi:peptidoglycan/xylan/chitin deacetylase (PgdA/CDA1 family)
MNKLPPPVQLAEVWWAEQTIALVCGRPPSRLYRPPHGGTDAPTEQYLAAHGYRTIMWSKNPSDWRLDGSVTVASIRSKILPISDGDIVCFHLRNTETVDALADILPGLSAAGFEFRTLQGADGAQADTLDVTPGRGDYFGSRGP